MVRALGLLPLLLLLGRGLARLGDSDLGDAAGREHAVAAAHAPRQELVDAVGDDAAPMLGVRAAGRQRDGRGGGHGRRGRGHRAVAVTHTALLQLPARVLLRQLGYGQSPLADFGRAGRAEWPAAGCHQRAVDARGHAHHVVHHAIVLRVLRETEGEGGLEPMGYLLASASRGCGLGHQLLEFRPLWDVALTELLGAGLGVQPPDAVQGLEATGFKGPVSGVLPSPGIHCMNIRT